MISYVCRKCKNEIIIIVIYQAYSPSLPLQSIISSAVKACLSIIIDKALLHVPSLLRREDMWMWATCRDVLVTKHAQRNSCGEGVTPVPDWEPSDVRR